MYLACRTMTVHRHNCYMINVWHSNYYYYYYYYRFFLFCFFLVGVQIQRRHVEGFIDVTYVYVVAPQV